MPKSFVELGLTAKVLESIDDLGYEEPSPVQVQAIPSLMSGKDVVAQAQTGTGKTAAYAIPLIEGTAPDVKQVQSVVLVPTRELAVQVAEAIHALGRHRGVSVLPIYGGQPYDRQLRALRAGVHVVVGTPGRMMDHIRRKTLRLETVRFVVLDEADEMLDMGFIEDIEFILEQVPGERQTAMFSATIPARIRALAGRYLREPEWITIPRQTQTAPQTRQVWLQVPYREKLEALSRILDFQAPPSAIVFCRTKREVDSLAEALEARGYRTAAIHGDISQAQREQQLRAFREGRVEVLVATDVAARGLDIPDVSHVINYDIPDDTDAYVHRVGRTGRMGRKGEAVTLVTPREMRLLRTIEQQTRHKLKQLQLPSLEDVAARRREALVETLESAMATGAGKPYATLVEGLAQKYAPLAIAEAALALAAAGSARGDGFVPEPVGARRVARETPATEAGMTRLFLDAGRKRGLRPRDVLEGFAAQAGVAPSTIGAIDLYDNFAFIEVRPSAARKLLDHPQLTLHEAEVHVKKAEPRRA